MKFRNSEWLLHNNVNIQPMYNNRKNLKEAVFINRVTFLCDSCLNNKNKNRDRMRILAFYSGGNSISL